MQSHFDLFGLAPAYALETDALERSYREIQSKVHPDRFAHAGDAERRASLQWTTRVNEAYRTLKDPVQRAKHLLELHGVDVAFETNTAMPPEFLMQQMAWREGLDEAATAKAVEAIAADIDTHRRAAYAELARSIDDAGDFEAASRQVRALMFVERFAGDVDERLAAREV